MNSWNTKTHSSKEMTQFCFKYADVYKHLVLHTEDEKHTVTFFRMCGNEALYAVHIFHPHTHTAGVEWCGTGHWELTCPPPERLTWVRFPTFARDVCPGPVTPGTSKLVLRWLRLWRCRVSSWTGWPGVSILWLGEVDSFFLFLFFVFAYLWGSPLFGWDFCVCDRFFQSNH